MSNLWDVFISDRLEVSRSLTLADVRKGIDQGEFRDDDLIRPAGTTTPWIRLNELGELADVQVPTPLVVAPPEMPVIVLQDDNAEQDSFALTNDDDDDDDDADITHFAPDDEEDDDADITGFALDKEDDEEGEADSAEALVIDSLPAVPSSQGAVSAFAIPTAPWGGEEMDLENEADDLDFDEDDEEFDDEDEAVAAFTLSRNGPDQVEELDLAAMVDVAFQLVLFFLVTAQTIMYKTLEVPKPNPESPPAAVAQGRGRTLDDLQRDFIVVEIDASGGVMIDHEPATADPAALVERLRAARLATGRKTMLLSADFSTPHKNAVMAYDAANEVGLGIAIAKPPAPGAGKS